MAGDTDVFSSFIYQCLQANLCLFPSAAVEQLLPSDCRISYPQVLAAGDLLAGETQQNHQQVGEGQGSDCQS